MYLWRLCLNVPRVEAVLMFKGRLFHIIPILQGQQLPLHLNLMAYTTRTAANPYLWALLSILQGQQLPLLLNLMVAYTTRTAATPTPEPYGGLYYKDSIYPYSWTLWWPILQEQQLPLLLNLMVAFTTRTAATPTPEPYGCLYYKDSIYPYTWTLWPIRQGQHLPLHLNPMAYMLQGLQLPLHLNPMGYTTRTASTPTHAPYGLYYKDSSYPYTWTLWHTLQGQQLPPTTEP